MFDKEETCKLLCTFPTGPEEIGLLRTRIEQEYFVNWIADDLPAIPYYEPNEAASGDKSAARCSTLGCYDSESGDNIYLYNHITFVVSYSLVDNPADEGDPLYRVVGFEAHLASIDHGNDARTCSPSSSPMTLTDDVTSISYTYDVEWKLGTVDWANRWNAYFYTGKFFFLYF